jgi:hypothetical protein
MKTKDIFKYTGLFVCIAGFIYGAMLFYEASKPCSSDGCMIHLLYIIAVPMMLISGIVGYIRIRSINRSRQKDSNSV